jgi:hypothetical protein
MDLGCENSYPDETASSASLDISSLVPGPPGLMRKPAARPSNATMIARPVPQEYQRKGVDKTQHNSEVGGLLIGPGTYAFRPTTHGIQGPSTINDDDDDDEAMMSTNDERNDSAQLSDDPQRALEAQVVPERDLNRKVQQKMEDITIDPIAVKKSKTKIDALKNGPSTGLCKRTLLITLGILMVLVAGSSAIGALASKNKKDPPPKIAPTVVSALELARALFTPLSGNETLWDESSPQYKAPLVDRPRGSGQDDDEDAG